MVVAVATVLDEARMRTVSARRRPRGPAARRLVEPRPRRGSPDETRTRLVAAAAEELNRAGYHGTDSNRIARAAGYAPGTFYKHFPDKRAILLAAYEAWVTTEWQAIERIVQEPTGRESKGGSTNGRAGGDLASRIVDAVLVFHRRWQGLRTSLRGLVAVDPEVRAFYRAQRRRQLDSLRALRRGSGTAEDRAADALLLYTLERVCDAVAEGEARTLGVAEDALRTRLVDAVAAALRRR
jgi:AcrR family transcriptional regulator